MQKVLDFVVHDNTMGFDVFRFGTDEPKVLDKATMLILAFLIGPGVVHISVLLVFVPLLMP
jgi:hypothetical protein